MASSTKGATSEAQHLKQQLAALEKRVASKNSLIVELRKQSADSKSKSSSKSKSKSKSSKDSAKQQKLDVSCALDKDEILDEIFSFVGCKEWAFVAGVCRRWRGRYFSMCVKAARAKGADVYLYQTSYRSTWATRARFALALEYGMPVVPEATIQLVDSENENDDDNDDNDSDNDSDSDIDSDNNSNSDSDSDSDS
eukprot:10612-Heterococcus_DN1.PRE.1